MPFIALEVALDAAEAAAPLIAQLERHKHSSELADQLRRAASSAPLQLAEGRRRRGRDATMRYGYGAGSADEARTCLELAVRLGFLTRAEVATAWRLYDRCVGLLWPFTKP